jgi:hypothetical protein
MNGQGNSATDARPRALVTIESFPGKNTSHNLPQPTAENSLVRINTIFEAELDLSEAEDVVVLILGQGDNAMKAKKELGYVVQKIVEESSTDGITITTKATLVKFGITPIINVPTGRYGVNEKNVILRTLKEVRWNRRQAARILGISYNTLRRRIAHYKLE